MDEIHALGAAVSLASDDARAVKGGNWQIFHSMLQDAKADVRLGNEVNQIAFHEGNII
jgi:prenylcysteine oxidase/farnesylcysteine lyase